MKNIKKINDNEIDYLKLLSNQYPTISSASTEVINLQAILDLPKGTEHFMSDLHGEADAFLHICNNASGVIREKVDILYEGLLSTEERASFSTLIYYPEEKLKEFAENDLLNDKWYKITLDRLINVCRMVSTKYTRSKVRKTLPKDFAYIIEELIHTNFKEPNKKEYYNNILQAVIDIGRADAFIIAICASIKKLVIDKFHIVGDIYDRGPRADIVMDTLMKQKSVDIQWGNHDILWMAAASGSRTCIAIVLNNSITYNNLEFIETGYGISLRPLATFANEQYGDNDVSIFMPRVSDKNNYKPKDLQLVARMHKAIAIIQFKLEGHIIKLNPEFGMSERLLLDKINYEKGTIVLNGVEHKLRDSCFPTIDPADPYKLSDDELDVIDKLKFAFLNSEKLQKHIKFLYTNGSIYKCHNSNLLFHGCIPMNDDGSFTEFTLGGKKLSGKKFMDYADLIARQGFYAKPRSKEKTFGKNFLWFLWCGKDSPVFGKKRMTTFERLFIKDESTWKEAKNAYYKYYDTEETCLRILEEFQPNGKYSHIINGHIPVKFKDGESPLKANGRLIVIDGGFCRAYQKTTGIAGYTLIYNSYGLRISSHAPFNGRADAIKNNRDILTQANVCDKVTNRIKVAETDDGTTIKKQILNLKKLLFAYHEGIIEER